MIGNVKEYEKTILIDGIEVPESELEAFNKRRTAAIEAQRKAAQQATAAKPARSSCPFRDGLNSECMHDNCALFLNGACTFAQIAEQPATNTAGKRCAINRYNKVCNADCALYKNGCMLTGLIEKVR